MAPSEPQTFWHITVPLMRPVILFDAIISTIGAFNLFAEPYALFGPNGGIEQAGLVTGTLALSVRLRILQVRAWLRPRLGAGDGHRFALSMIQPKVGNRSVD